VPYLVRRAVAAYPDTIAVDDGLKRRTLIELVSRAERLANCLDGIGIPPRATVGILSGNRAEYPEVDLGIALGRRVRMALNVRLHFDDFRFALEDSEASALIYSAEFEEVAARLESELGLTRICLDGGAGTGALDYEELLARASATATVRAGGAEDPGWISYTSGTTGRPKGVVLSHRALREVAFNLLLELGPVRPGEQIVLTQPLSHGAGYFVLPQLISGGGIYIARRFDPEELQAVSRRPEVTVLKIVPAMLPAILEQRGDFGFATIVYGASPMPTPLMESALDRLGPVLVQIYGQSEAPVTLTCLRKEDHASPGTQRASAGRAWKSVALEVRDPEGAVVRAGVIGEVTVRGSHTMSGYLHLPKESSEVLREGWIWTRDMGRVDDRGFVYLVGRKDEMINSGGFKISPREVEQVLLRHPAVIECVAIGVEDRQWGSAVNAVIRLRKGASPSSEEIIQFAKPRLGFRCPKRVVVAPEIPKTAYGKVDRAAILSLLGTNQASLGNLALGASEGNTG